jgi:hypothetical protein
MQIPAHFRVPKDPGFHFIKQKLNDIPSSPRQIISGTKLPVPRSLSRGPIATLLSLRPIVSPHTLLTKLGGSILRSLSPAAVPLQVQNEAFIWKD